MVFMMGEGQDGGGLPGPFPPHLNPLHRGREELFFGSIGVKQCALPCRTIDIWIVCISDIDI